MNAGETIQALTLSKDVVEDEKVEKRTKVDLAREGRKKRAAFVKRRSF